MKNFSLISLTLSSVTWKRGGLVLFVLLLYIPSQQLWSWRDGRGSLGYLESEFDAHCLTCSTEPSLMAGLQINVCNIGYFKTRGGEGGSREPSEPPGFATVYVKNIPVGTYPQHMFLWKRNLVDFK